MNLQRSGVSGYWIGMEINSKGKPIWADGTSVYYNEFQEDASKDPGSCVLAKTTSGHNNWDTIGCNEQHPFICTASVGARIKIPDDINADYRCDEGWHYFKDQLLNENCYKITRNPQEMFEIAFQFITNGQ